MKVVEKLMQSVEGKKLNVGCGATPEKDWINLDMKHPLADITMEFMAYADSTEADQYVQILMSHVLEHVARPDSMRFLRCAHKILIPNGELTVIVPDFDYIAECWTRYTDVWRYLDLHDRVYGLQTHEGEFHRSAWNNYHLGNALKHTGFKDVWTSYTWDHEQRTVIGRGIK